MRGRFRITETAPELGEHEGMRPEGLDPRRGESPHLFGWSRPSVSHLGGYPVVFQLALSGQRSRAAPSPLLAPDRGAKEPAAGRPAWAAHPAAARVAPQLATRAAERSFCHAVRRLRARRAWSSRWT